MNIKGILLLKAAAFVSCKDTMLIRSAGESKLTLFKDVAQDKWDALSKKRIYFGHQSVGFNIIDGIKDILKENPNINLKIVEADAIGDTPVFAHSRIGKNTEPVLKCDAFKEVIQKNRLDVTFMKLCYIDILRNSDAAGVFSYYKKTIETLQTEYPRLEILHCTVPLESSPRNIKAKIKRFIGHPVSTDENNIKRNEFNKLLLEAYKDKVFDLAFIEATYPNNHQEIVMQNEIGYYSLVPQYTDDGGHLNKIGRKMVAERLLTFLATSL